MDRLQHTPANFHRPIQFSQLMNPISSNRASQNYPRSVSIKINRNKLPPDFFPRTQSVRKSKPNHQKRKFPESGRRSESLRDHYSPEKTSFFGSFEEKSNNKNTLSQLNNLQRKFESREEPKRQKIVPEMRHFTPINGKQRIGLLNLYSERPDIEMTQAIMSSNKSKGFQMSVRNQHFSKYRQIHQSQLHSLNPEAKKLENISCLLKRSEEDGTIDSHNITFFNAKSTAFPPINKANN